MACRARGVCPLPSSQVSAAWRAVPAAGVALGTGAEAFSPWHSQTWVPCPVTSEVSSPWGQPCPHPLLPRGPPWSGCRLTSPFSSMTLPGSPGLGWCQAEVAAECPFGPRKVLPLCHGGYAHPTAPHPILAGTEMGLPNDTLGGSECVTQLLWAVRAPPVASCFWGALGPLETASGPVRGHHALLEPDDHGLRRAGLSVSFLGQKQRLRLSLWVPSSGIVTVAHGDTPQPGCGAAAGSWDPLERLEPPAVPHSWAG